MKISKEMIDCMSHNKFIIFDTESTGFSIKEPYPDELTEIGAIKVINGEIVEEFDELIKPMNHVLNKGTAVTVTGITDEMVANCPGYTEVLSKFHEFCNGDYVFIMHNAKHDMSFIQYWGSKLGCSFDHPHIDTLALSKSVLDQAWLGEMQMRSKPSHKLQELAHVFNIPDPSHHRAKNDAEVTWKVFLKIREEYYRTHPEESLKKYSFTNVNSEKHSECTQRVLSVAPWSNEKYFRIYVRIVNENSNGEKGYANVFFDFTRRLWGVKDTMFQIKSFDKIEETVKKMYGIKSENPMMFQDFKEKKFNNN